MRRLSVTILMAVVLGGCFGGLVKEKPPAVYYELDYSPAVLDCTGGFGDGVTVRTMSVFAPFDRTEMVVEKPDRQVLFSEAHQWVDLPGRMVAEKLARDLAGGNIFPAAGIAGGPLKPLELTGRIERFGWERRDAASVAKLHAEISLIDPRPRDVLMRQSYRLESPPSSSGDADAFAEAMSRLVKELSNRLQKDLCDSAIRDDNPLPPK